MKNYVLKVVDRDMRTRVGFLWAPVGGVTTAPDWDPSPVCGKGLHGWLNGTGDIGCQPWSYDDGAIWLVLEVIGPVVDLNRKVKFQSAKTLFSGSMSDAAREIVRLSGEQGPVIGVTRRGSDHCTLTGGDCSTLTGGDHSTLTGRDRSTLTGGDHSTLTGGYDAILTGGNRSTLTGGDHSTLTGGYGSILSIYYYDKGLRRLATAYVGEDGILPGIPYRLNDEFKFEVAK